MIDAPVLLAGAAVGAGIALVARGLAADTPDLTDALRTLDGTAPRRLDTTRHGHATTVIDRAATWLRLDRYSTDLDVVGETTTTLMVRKSGYAMLGLVFPPLLTTTMLLLGVAPPVLLPAVASVALAAGLFMLPDLDLRRRASTQRVALRRAVCAYIELVALERAADAGTIEALDRAATVADCPAFVRIHDALVAAQLAGQPSWSGLSTLGERVGVSELDDLADIMRLSGQDGAAVYTTLRARASSLRTQLLTADAAAANAASEHMIVPVALLGLAFMALIGYPAFARILFG